MKSFFQKALLLSAAWLTVAALRAQEEPASQTEAEEAPTVTITRQDDPETGQQMVVVEVSQAQNTQSAQASDDDDEKTKAPQVLSVQGGAAPVADEAPETPAENDEQANTAQTSSAALPAAAPAPAPELTAAELLVKNSPFLPPNYFLMRQSVNLPRPSGVDPVEFRAAVRLNGHWQFSFYDAKNRRSFWVGEQDEASPYRVQGYDEKTQQVSVEINGALTQLPIKTPSDQPLAINAGGAAPKAAAKPATQQPQQKNAQAQQKAQPAAAQQPARVVTGGSATTQAQVQQPAANTQQSTQNSSTTQRRRIVAPAPK